MKNKHKIRIDLSAVQLVMCRVPENPKTRPEPRLFYWPEPDPNPKKKSKTRPEPTRKNCKPARNPMGFISSKVRAKLPIFWWEFRFFQKNLPPYQFYIFYSAHIFLLIFINKFFSNNQNFFCNFQTPKSNPKPDIHYPNPTRTRKKKSKPDSNRTRKKFQNPNPTRTRLLPTRHITTPNFQK